MHRFGPQGRASIFTQPSEASVFSAKCPVCRFGPRVEYSFSQPSEASVVSSQCLACRFGPRDRASVKSWVTCLLSGASVSCVVSDHGVAHPFSHSQVKHSLSASSVVVSDHGVLHPFSEPSELRSTGARARSHSYQSLVRRFRPRDRASFVKV